MNKHFVKTVEIQQINVDAFELGMPYHLYRTKEYRNKHMHEYQEYIGILTALSKNYLEFTVVKYMPTNDEKKNGKCNVITITLTASDLSSWEIDIAEFPIPSYGTMYVVCASPKS